MKTSPANKVQGQVVTGAKPKPLASKGLTQEELEDLKKIFDPNYRIEIPPQTAEDTLALLEMAQKYMKKL